jgi:hypothetical protein
MFDRYRGHNKDEHEAGKKVSFLHLQNIQLTAGMLTFKKGNMPPNNCHLIYTFSICVSKNYII